MGDFNTSLFEAPETPAHIFAIRAFKHAIFGTPRPNEEWLKPAEEVEDEESASPNNSHRKPQRRATIHAPVMNAPATLFESPSKPASILMTPGVPGTGAGRKKNVSFGGTQLKSQSDTKTENNTFQQRLLTAKESTKLPGDFSPMKAKSETTSITTPHADDSFWKAEYEAFASKSKREAQKLVLKQKVAKDYARTKDAEAMQLAGELSHERRRVMQLEAQVQDLQKQMRQLQKQLDEAQKPSKSTSKPVREADPTTPARKTQRVAEVRNKTEDEVHAMAPPNAAPDETSKVRPSSKSPRKRSRSERAADALASAGDDLFLELAGSNSPVPSVQGTPTPAKYAQHNTHGTQTPSQRRSTRQPLSERKTGNEKPVASHDSNVGTLKPELKAPTAVNNDKDKENENDTLARFEAHFSSSLLSPLPKPDESLFLDAPRMGTGSGMHSLRSPVSKKEGHGPVSFGVTSRFEEDDVRKTTVIHHPMPTVTSIGVAPVPDVGVAKVTMGRRGITADRFAAAEARMKARADERRKMSLR